MRPPEPQHSQYQDLMNEYSDLNVVERRLANGEYQNSREFITEVRNLFIRNIKFQRDFPIIQARAKELSLIFENLIKDLE